MSAILPKQVKFRRSFFHSDSCAAIFCFLAFPNQKKESRENMAKINMRDYYPFYQHDEYVEVSDELAAEMAQWERAEKAQSRKRYRYRANYSLEWRDGIG